MVYLFIEIILWIILAIVLGFLVGWLLKIWPFWKRFNEYEKSFEAYRSECESKINKLELNYRKKLRKFKDDQQATIDSLKDQIAKLEKRLSKHNHTTKVPIKRASTSKKKPVRAQRVKAKDNLKEIIGVDKVLERLLHRQKIYTFKQIANFSKKDIDKISEKFSGFNDRIKRDKWIQQAKRLMKRKIK